MMDRDTTTRTGARTPGVDRLCRSNGGACCPMRLGIDREKCVSVPASTKDRCKPTTTKGMPGAGLTGIAVGKALSETPALKPYWGKPAVRNFREGNGNVGIIRSPVRAIALPGDLVRARGGKLPRATRQNRDLLPLSLRLKIPRPARGVRVRLSIPVPTIAAGSWPHTFGGPVHGPPNSLAPYTWP